MNRLADTLRIVPVPVRVAAVLLAGPGILGVPIGIALAILSPRAETFSGATLLVPLAVFLLVVAAWLLLIGYIYADARRRGMRYVAWTVTAVIMPSAIGILLYFVMRETTRPCVSCGATINSRHAYCPRCGAASGQVCPNCRRPTEPTWSNCANCGVALNAPAPAV